MAKFKQLDSQVDGEQPQVLVLDDGTEITLDEIDKGYMRQSDYTKKTQALAEQTKALGSAQANQHVEANINSQAQGNPDIANMTKMYLDTKMANMKSIYGDDFDEVAILTEAASQLENGVAATNIDFVKIHKAMAFDKVAVNEAKIREKIMAELSSANIDTSSIISSGDVITGQAGKVNLTPQEKSYCDKTGMPYDEYAKYKN